ncbi:MAG TPA: hypothetical protein EYH34_10790 [Planctomycetes bacterium]|nr:hypothetical protein [Planctomycetota bacterium]
MTQSSFFARHRFTIVLVMMFVMPFIGVGTLRALKSNINNVRDWLPEGFKETAQHSWFQAHFPHEQFVLVSWEGCTLYDQRLELLARKLVPPVPESGSDEASEADQAVGFQGAGGGKPSFFKSVLTGARLVDELQRRYPDLSQQEILERLRGSLIGDDGLSTCLVVTLTQAAQGKNLRKAVEEIRRIATEECAIPDEEIRMGGPPVDNVAIDVEGERTLYRLALLSAVVGFSISWLCFRSTRLTAIVFWVSLLSAGTALTFVAAAGILFPHSSYGTCDAVLLSMPTLVYVLAISGSIHIINYYHDAIREVGLRGAVELGVRHALRPCSLAALTTALGLGSLVISNVIPISKFGLYSAIGVMSTLLLIFLYLPALLDYFPSRAFAQRCADRQHGAAKDHLIIRWWRWAGGLIVRHNTLVATGCLAVMVFFVIGVSKIHVSVKLMKLFSPDAEIIAHYRWLEEQLGPLVPMEVVLRFDNETNRLSFVERMRLAQHVERTIETELAEHVGGALSAATFAPDITPRRTGAVLRAFGLGPRTSDSVLNKRLEQHRQEFREYLAVDTSRLETDDPRLDQLRIRGKLAELLEAYDLTTLKAIRSFGDLTVIKGMTPELAAEVIAKIDAWQRARYPALSELGLPEQIVQALEARGLDSLDAVRRYGPEAMAFVEGIGQEGAQQIASALQRWERAHGDELWRISARVRALSDLDYGLFVDVLKAKVEPLLEAYRQRGVQGLDAVYTGLVPLVYKTQHELFRGLFESLILAFGLIAVLMVFVLRSLWAGLLAMVPNLFPVVVIFGIMGWMGILVDIGSMMTASVALGVAVDDTIHYLTWYRSGLDQGLNRRRAALFAYERCATAMTQTTLIGGLGLAVFAFSTFTPTQRFGVLMLTLLAAAVVGDLVFLPAVLTGPLGRFFRPRGAKRKPEPPRGGPEHEPAAAEASGAEVKAGTCPHMRPDPSHPASKVAP